MIALPLLSVMTAAIVLAMSRPYADAARPPSWLALGAGALMGAVLRGAVDPAALIDAMRPAAALAAGWMALCAAEGWRGSRPLRPAAGSISRLLVPATAVGVLTLLSGGSAAWPAALLAAGASMALDPAAARLHLQGTTHPSPTARRTPAVVALAGAMALGASVIPFSLALSDGGAGVDPLNALARAALCLGLGAAAGVIAAGLMRLAQGRAAMFALLVPLPLLMCGAAGLMGAPALPAIFMAGLIVARDVARRDLLSTVITEVEMPMNVMAMMLLGALLATASSWPQGGLMLAATIAVSLALAALVAGRAVAPATSLLLPLSPLVAAMALEAAAWSLPAACGLAVGMAGGEILWLIRGRMAGARHA
ncbi:MAG: hypothetical protein ACREAA_17280 [Candidatus Polarisedimenticolia bacterium]